MFHKLSSFKAPHSLIALLVIVGIVGNMSPTAYALNCTPPYTFNPDTNHCEKPAPATPAPAADGGTSGGAPAPSTPKVTRYDPNDAEKDPALNGGKCANLNACDLLTTYVNPAIRFLTAFVGIGVTIAIVYGGIEYGSSAGDPAKAAAGKNRIRNALVALLGFFFLYALLNFLIPGGIGA